MQTYLIVTPYFPTPASWRGAYVYDFAVALRRTGRYDVRVLVPGPGGNYTYQGIDVIRFPHRMLPSASFPFLFDTLNRRSFLDRLRRSGITPESVAVCHAHTVLFAAYALAVKAVNPRCRTLLHHHSGDSFGLYIGRLNRFLWHRRLCWPYLVRLHEGIDLHLCISEAVRRSLKAVPRVGWPHPRYEAQLRGLQDRTPPRLRATAVLYNGVDTARFTPAPRRPHTGFRIGCIANFIPQKGHLTLLKALRRCSPQLPDWHLAFIGTGPTRRICEAYVRKCGWEGRVTFEAERDHTLLPDFYRTLDLFVLPSAFEGFGCVCAEAHACGVPFIAGDDSGIAELIPSGRRDLWLCHPGNAENLAGKILRFHRERPLQHLTSALDIDTLVRTFLDDILR